MEKGYYKFSAYLKEHFGTKVSKISVDAGFSCPNKDGKINRDGCIYCDNRAFSFQARQDKPLGLQKQIRDGIEAAKKKFKAEKFIVYFQAYTNTYAPINVLKQNYDVIKEFKDIVGISIATRPDCVDEDILKLIDSYADKYEVWIEYGLQSIHNKTLQLINRGHSYEDFLKTFEMTKKYRIKICVHVILGLPDETEEMMMQTAKEMARIKIDAIKIHPLHIIKDTKLNDMFKKGEYRPLELDEYIKILTKLLSSLGPEIVIERISALCPKELLVAPEWVSQRNAVENRLFLS
jgi:radical SAM protein (TIGR01212 family)